MSALITTKLVTPCGTVVDSTAINYMDAAGNIKGSPGFLPNYVVDYAGNLGTLVVSNCDFNVTIIGGALEPGPWEAQIGAVETIGSNYSINPNNYAGPTTNNFVSANTTGTMSGVVSGTTWNIQGAEYPIGGVMYNGGGLLIATGANTATTTYVEGGARFQLGGSTTTTNGSTQALYTYAGALVDVVGAYTAYTTKATTVTNNSTINFTGPNVCGQGMMQVTAMNNAADVVIDDAILRATSSWAGNGRTLVKDGGTFDVNNLSIGSSTQVFTINGCGWCSGTGALLGAIRFGTVAANFSSQINVATASCITSAGTATATLAGPIIGGADLTFSCDVKSPVASGLFAITNNPNTFYGNIIVDGTTVRNSVSSTQYAKIILKNGGRLLLDGNTSTTIRSIESTDQTTYWNIGGSSGGIIAANGETTFSGRLWGDGSNTYNYYLNGGAANILHLNHNTTTGGHMGTMYVRNGAKLILEDGTKFTGTQGQIRLDTGAGILSSNTTTSSATYIYLNNGAILDVQKVGTGTSKITSTLDLNTAGGFKVNVPAGLTAGVYPILQANVGGTLSVPTVNANLSGLTPTFAWTATNPRVLNMTLS